MEYCPQMLWNIGRYRVKYWDYKPLNDIEIELKRHSNTPPGPLFIN